MEIKPLQLPVIPAAEPPTRGMSPPLSRGMKPPRPLVPGYDPPTLMLPNNIPVEPQGEGGNSQEEEESSGEEGPSRDMPDLPMAPFDASTTLEFTVPIIEQPVEIPVPKPEVVITAGTTAFVATTAATGAAVFAKPLFDQAMKVLKPLIKQVLNRILKKKKVDYSKIETLKIPQLRQLHYGVYHLEPEQSRQHKSEHKETVDG